MFEKFFSSIGFEGAEVRTTINPSTFSPGDAVNGLVTVKGGQGDQQIAGIQLTLFVFHDNEVRSDSDFSYYDEELKQVVLKDVTEIKANEKKEIPFTMLLSDKHPRSSSVIQTYIQTKLLVHNGVDPEDKDVITIK
ncbi:sporulation protein [Jeotgalibacillus sp. ET6]|uniref:sporulation protein n=1 Tax=Jeotgalibacillus sp. ET6 TaxID=3037260 RepID=UPI002418A13F|nr:sporulation protein [Jeotgalibacillus sp. ET6]MDG5470449.1 sporulation protein [Jeotgalibacillus sp. ET6]